MIGSRPRKKKYSGTVVKGIPEKDRWCTDGMTKYVATNNKIMIGMELFGLGWLSFTGCSVNS